MDAALVKKYNLDAAAVTRTVQHCDYMVSGELGKMVQNADGFLEGRVPVAKVGVLSYMMADGSVFREFVPPETLFNADSMNSMKMRPLTNSHPPERRVTAENAKFRQIGSTGETVEQKDSFLTVLVCITDGDAISSIKSGRQQLSPGYAVQLLDKKGVTEDGQEYDAIQVNRKYNHLAVVDSARGGKELKMRLDGAEITEENLNQESSMKFRIDGIDYEAAPEVVNHIARLDGQIKENGTKIQALTTANETLKGEKDSLKTKNDQLEARDIKKEVQDAVEARLSLERLAGVVLDSVDTKLDNRALKVAIVTKKLPELAKRIDAKTTEAYLDAVLDGIVSSLSKEDSDVLAAQRKVSTTKVDASDNTNLDAEDVARKAYLDRLHGVKPAEKK